VVEEIYIFLGKGGETSENYDIFILRLTGRNEDTPFFCLPCPEKNQDPGLVPRSRMHS